LATVDATVKAMQRLGELVGEPETAVVISPHTNGYRDAHIVRTSRRLYGDFSRFRAPQATFSYDNDLPFVELLLARAADHHVHLVAEEDDILDWGVLVPLSFLRVRQIVSLSIVSAYEGHRAFGAFVRRCAEELGRDTLFAASGDLSHALGHSGPAPYDPRGALFDAEVVRLMRAGDFAGLSDIDPSLRSGAAECGLRSFMTLGGFLGADAEVSPQVLSYEGPFGVGYLVAVFGAPAVSRPGVQA
jgi:aromatic ring-opening dioxygenase LigB subunit